MRKISVYAIVALAMAVIAVPAANAGNFYVGGSFGSTSADVSGSDDDTGFKVTGGYNFLKNLSVEAAWVDVGDETSTDGFAVDAVGILPFAQKFEVFARAGFYKWDADVAGASGADGTDPKYGVGFGWNAWNNGQVRLEAERYTMETTGVDVDVDMISAGFNWRF